jgi:RNA polymerase sigma-70 factor (ECF subfamily)
MKSSEPRHPDTAGVGSAPPGVSKEADAQFDVCFRAYHAAVLAYALRRFGERGAAEDAAAQTFAVAWRRLDALPGDPLPWLFGIAHLVIQNEARSTRRRSRLLARVTSQYRSGAGQSN